MPLVEARIKVVADVERAGTSPAQLRTWLLDTVQPRLVTAFQTRIGAVTPGVEHEKDMRAWANPLGDGRYWLYPKLTLRGDSSATANQIANRLANLTQDLVDILTEEVGLAGGTLHSIASKFTGGRVNGA